MFRPREPNARPAIAADDLPSGAERTRGRRGRAYGDNAGGWSRGGDGPSDDTDSDATRAQFPREGRAAADGGGRHGAGAPDDR